MDGSTNIDNTSATLESSYCGGPCSILESLSLSVCFLTNWENNNEAKYTFVKLHKPLKRNLDTLFEFKVICFICQHTWNRKKESFIFLLFTRVCFFQFLRSRWLIYHTGVIFNIDCKKDMQEFACYCHCHVLQGSSHLKSPNSEVLQWIRFLPKQISIFQLWTTSISQQTSPEQVLLRAPAAHDDTPDV